MQIDGEEATSKAVAARLAAFWIPSTSVLYIGTSQQSMAARVGAIERTALGDRRPYAGGNWLKTLTGLERARVWWAGTDATEEYEDALFSAFAAAIPEADRERAATTPTVVLPFANLRSTGGERKAHGLTGYLVPEEIVAPVPAGRRSSNMPPGDAEGAGGLPASRAGRRNDPTNRPRARAASPAAPRGTAPPHPPARRRAANARAARASPTYLSAEGIERLRAEHAELTGHEAAGGDRPDQVGQGARRPQGERRLLVGARGAVVPRGPDRRRSRRSSATRRVIEAPAASADGPGRPRVEGLDRGWPASPAR